MRVYGIVWKRSDFRESSRIVTLLTRERGRIRALAKGAHRPKSILLGKLDYLNRVEVDLAGRGVPILGRTKLVHEPRALRDPDRFLAASYISALIDAASVDERADRDLFDLCDGGLALLERTPAEAIPPVVAGIELRLLGILGQLPDLQRCSACGVRLADADRSSISAVQGGVFCGAHPPRSATTLPAPVRAWLTRLSSTAPRDWPTLTMSKDATSSLGILARWLGSAIDTVPPARRAALRPGRRHGQQA